MDRFIHSVKACSSANQITEVTQKSPTEISAFVGDKNSTDSRQKVSQHNTMYYQTKDVIRQKMLSDKRCYKKRRYQEKNVPRQHKVLKDKARCYQTTKVLSDSTSCYKTKQVFIRQRCYQTTQCYKTKQPVIRQRCY